MQRRTPDSSPRRVKSLVLMLLNSDLKRSFLCSESIYSNLLQNSQLLIDARAARAYRDEVDALRERAIKADKLESEAGRYREQLHKMEFYKAKVEVDAALWRYEL